MSLPQTHVDANGFVHAKPPEEYKVPSFTPLLLKKWQMFLGQPHKQTKQLKVLCRRGIPKEIKGKVWLWLTASPVLEYIIPTSKEDIFDVIECDIQRCYPGK